MNSFIKIIFILYGHIWFLFYFLLWNIKNEVLEAAEEARDMPLPEESSLFSDIFKEDRNGLAIKRRL